MLIAQHGAVAALARRYGSPFTLNLPLCGPTVVISEPALVKDLFGTSRHLLGRSRLNLGDVIGPGSLFNLEGDELLKRRKLLLPPFHGNRMRSYEHLIEEEVLREVANWPQGREFETLPSMLRITLKVILRAVFGAEGPALDELGELILPTVELGSRIAFLPAIWRRDLGRWSPGGRLLQYRRRIDAVIDSLIADARADPAFQERTDVLTLLLQARYENGEPMPDPHIADELVTLLNAGHETTSVAMAWAVERLRRHPRLLSRLTEEVDAGGSELRKATIWEVLRTRPVISGGLRQTKTRIRLGEWVIPEDYMVLTSITLAHDSEEGFADAAAFNPDRFGGAVPNPFAWIPFGGGMNRCIGAPLAEMEMNIALRTLLREFRLAPTNAPGERRHNRGITIAPGRGGRAVVYRRTADASSDGVSVSVTDHDNSRLGNR
jgi:hypothetical protein